MVHRNEQNWPWWKHQIIQRYSNGTWIWQKTKSYKNDYYSVDKDPYEWCLRQSKRLKAIDPQMNILMRNHKLPTQMPEELENAVKYHYSNNCPKAKKKLDAIEKVPEEEYPTEDSESDSMGDAIRDQSDE
ncbi:hypothetical protein O181_086401 [Austropuccinia psidii MF-1]|uniref:Uncharacterized protein n=1 Tax=Austropuccinia psidii MF-1 TaxID=1389203 RepID=A0A9Q3IKM5_9BASI|nr:hypothetical protein [Austropuccinia psidii MF-1]